MLDINEVHPVILPRANLITEAIVTWCHENAAHSGRSMTLERIIFGLLVPIQLCKEQSLDLLLVVSYVRHLNIKNGRFTKR